MYFLNKKWLNVLHSSFVEKHIYITVYVHVSTYKYKCVYVGVYLIRSRVRKEFVLPLWKTALYKSAFSELFPLLNYLDQGHEMVEMPMKERKNKGALQRNGAPGL